MVFINLIGSIPRPVHGSRTKALLAIALGLVLIGSLSLVWHRPEAQPVRALNVEEREAVLSLFEAVEAKLPQLREWTKDFHNEFNGGILSSTVDRRLGPGTLVQLGDQSVVFSPAFFAADPVTQEHWLVQIVVDANSPLEWNADEVARHGDE